MSKKLILFGGGPLPTNALEKFMHWVSGGLDPKILPKILVVAWASEEPEATAHSLSQKLCAKDPFLSLTPPLTRDQKEQFLQQLSQAEGVFFSGGDQNRVAEVLADPQILNALILKYNQGTPFAGTSAGTAIMSEIMICGDAEAHSVTRIPPTGSGLGLIKGVIFDQHFLLRGRQERLAQLIENHPEALGIGVDEGTALAIEDDHLATVLGPEEVILIRAKILAPDDHHRAFHSGESFDLNQERILLGSRFRKLYSSESLST